MNLCSSVLFLSPNVELDLSGAWATDIIVHLEALLKQGRLRGSRRSVERNRVSLPLDLKAEPRLPAVQLNSESVGEVGRGGQRD